MPAINECVHTCPHLHVTWLHPPFFSTGLLHLGQGLVLAAIQLRVSLSPLVFSSHTDQLQFKTGVGGEVEQRSKLLGGQVGSRRIMLNTVSP